ncbi:PTS glucitol/sorbitol transporter subunit IIC [Williamsia sp. CHRR-6]|uniref:PTS glucitol/sorbitol transporter subunit IIC n=1 Tax=Williamsia sp. CHRR-6 TaxID=2835871 RepID=UPI001BD9621D|nr:PTS glucitol/sorbitol transporter subunit IIC [Williamsia sp. CHRR-6]MBT0566039.1 PTS glucitol/sorbitol transporter subunit IIC [Williamsia sp. CHRR-6]
MLQHTVQFLAETAPTQPDPGGINGILANWAEHFIGVFQEGAKQFTALLTGIVPLLVVLLTAVNALIRLIGTHRIEKVGELAGRDGLQYYPLRYLVLPVLSMFFLTNPMAYTLGRFLPERRKPAFYDSAVSFCHPITAIFPHANPGEYFVYAGIAAGITKLNLPLSDLAVRYFYVGLLVIFIRGIVTDILTGVLMRRRERAVAAAAATA